METQTSTPDPSALTPEMKDATPDFNPNERMWKVKDLNGKTERRPHDLGDGIDMVRYWLNAYLWEDVPERHARYCVKEGFLVMDHRGKLLEATKGNDETALIQVPPGFTVAAFNELTATALAERCSVLPHGSGAHTNWGKKQLIDILMTNQRSEADPGQAAADAETAERAEGLDGGLVDEDLEVDDADDDPTMDHFAREQLPPTP